jgi:hypothetical protein
MKVNTIPLVMSSSTMSGTSTITSNPVPIDQIYGFAAQVVFTGTPTGTFKLQGSCDIPARETAQSNGGPDTITNWSDLSLTLAAAGAAGNGIINVNGAFYRYVRLVYTNTSGTGVLTVAQLCVKGV